MVFSKGYGLREVGKNEQVDADTVFLLASVSKPVGSTIIAELVGEGKIAWDSKISELDPTFKMYDPWVTREITIRDFYTHRSGLPDHAGDLLEDIGADRSLVLSRLQYQRPNSSFRSQYEYTNFGITEAAVAAAKAYGLDWETASELKLYKPLGMDSTSSRYSDFIARTNRALGHVLVDGKWVQKFKRDPDAQSPAGGVSSSANDMAKWMRLQLKNGVFEGRQVVAQKPIEETHHPLILTQFSPLTKLPGFYGLGMNVSYDEAGRLFLSHSGAFAMGASTNVTMIPGEELGIVVLTNSAPVGLAEGLAMNFTDSAIHGTASRDWVALLKRVFADPNVIGIHPGFDFSKPPAKYRPPLDSDAYVGTYSNDFFGKIQILRNEDGSLNMVLGPHKTNVLLTHYDHDTFKYETSGENAAGFSAVTFTIGPAGKSEAVVLEHLNELGEGSFKRVTK